MRIINGRTLRDIYGSLVDCPTTMTGNYHGRASQASVLLLMQIKSGGVSKRTCLQARTKKKKPTTAVPATNTRDEPQGFRTTVGQGTFVTYHLEGSCTHPYLFK